MTEIGLVLDRSDPDVLAQFWAPALGYSVRLGGRRVSSSALEEHGTRWHLMADPEGNELCVCDGGAGSAT